MRVMRTPPPHRTPGLVAAGVAAGVAALVAGCSTGSGGSDASPAATSLQLPSSRVVAPSVSPSAGLPPEAPAAPGTKYYAVFLAVATDAHDNSLAAAQQRAGRLGYNGGMADIDCTPGARAQLKLKAAGSYMAFSVLFATKAQAQQFVAAYPSGVVGTAYVTVDCLD